MIVCVAGEDILAGDYIVIDDRGRARRMSPRVVRYYVGFGSRMSEVSPSRFLDVQRIAMGLSAPHKMLIYPDGFNLEVKGVGNLYGRIFHE